MIRVTLSTILIVSCGQFNRSEHCVVKGENCAEGERGEPGPKGDRGDTGHTGTQGAKGDTGPVGPGGNPGATGPSGTAGIPGERGPAGEIGSAGSKGDRGDSGSNGQDGLQGPQGIPGNPGTPGTAGMDGVSIVSLMQAVGLNDAFCTYGGVRIYLAQDTNGNSQWDVTDDNQQMSSICNGANGEDGATAPYTPVGFVNPCGDAPGIWDEVFIRLANNMLLASFSDNIHGENTRLSVLVPGNYMTTDGDHCTFTVDGSWNITNENHHY